ncbi:hypothetical protein [Virgibacillus ihumii]|nr:hypothetical protein [Virgibacillus ihumii]
MKVKRIVTKVNTSDITKANHFYNEVLGLDHRGMDVLLCKKRY